MTLIKIIKQEIIELNSILNNIDPDSIKNFDLLYKSSLFAIKNKHKIIFCGNGGSAADAQHLAAELIVKYKKKRAAISALSLTTDTSILTAIGNDYDFSKIFSRQIEGIGNSGDILLLITTSGNSKNLIEATKAARKKKIKVFCFSGGNGGKLKKFCKNMIILPSHNTSLIQVIEIFFGQIYCGQLEKYFSK